MDKIQELIDKAAEFGVVEYVCSSNDIVFDDILPEQDFAIAVWAAQKGYTVESGRDWLRITIK